MLVEILERVVLSLFSKVGKLQRLLGEPFGSSANSTFVFFDETHTRVYIQKVTIYTVKTPTCFTRVNGWRFECAHRIFFSVPNHTHSTRLLLPPPTHRNTPQYHTEHAVWLREAWAVEWQCARFDRGIQLDQESAPRTGVASS